MVYCFYGFHVAFSEVNVWCCGSLVKGLTVVCMGESELQRGRNGDHC